jgi:predicted transcriptional regulator
VAKGVVLRSRSGDRVKVLLNETGISTEELAERSAIPAKRIQNMLNGSFIRITLRDMSIIAAPSTPLYNLLAPTDAPLLSYRSR